MRRMSYILVFIQYILIVLFIYAAVNKLIDHQKFYNDLRNSPLFSNPTISIFLSWSVPLVELIIATLIIIGKFTLKGLYASAILMMAFTLYISGILLWSADIPCSCGGIISNLTWGEHLIFNIGMTLLACMGIYLFKHQNETTLKP